MPQFHARTQPLTSIISQRRYETVRIGHRERSRCLSRRLKVRVTYARHRDVISQVM